MSASPPTPPPGPSGTPPAWRLGIAAGVVALAALAYLLRDTIPSRGQALCGVVCFLGVAAACSADLRRVRLRIVLVGLLLQVALAVFVLKTPVGYRVFDAVGGVIRQFLDFSVEGAKMVFGPLADREVLEKSFGGANAFVFAFMALPTIIFVSSFFSVLYYYGLMQRMVAGMAWVMRRTMGTGGAESLSAAANVFMGQTEAPLLVKPYVRRMNRSQLLALMVGGMATVSGGMLAVYVSLGADAVALLTTSVMAAPAGLYLAKILMPDPPGKTAADGAEALSAAGKMRHGVNAIDAASRGARAGLFLALNVAAMLIAFVAFITLINACLEPLVGMTLQQVLGKVFSPVALLIGIEGADVPKVGELLGTKLVVNELVAYQDLQQNYLPNMPGGMSAQSLMITTFALTGFANFASVGIQLGGIGAMAPNKRGALARLGMRALLGGTLATLINAAIAAVLV